MSKRRLRWQLRVMLVCALMIGSALALVNARGNDITIPPTRSASGGTGRLLAESEPIVTTETVPIDELPSITTPPAAVHAPSGFDRYDALITGITVFALAVYVGFEVISKVPTTLHTPLMSGSNAISGITVVGAIIVAGFAINAFSSMLGGIAIALAMINVVGGFVVTHRMLVMFKRK